MKEVTLDKVNYATCKNCGRGFPQAIWIQPLGASYPQAIKEIDMFKPNNNTHCKPCRKLFVA